MITYVFCFAFGFACCIIVWLAIEYIEHANEAADAKEKLNKEILLRVSAIPLSELVRSDNDADTETNSAPHE